MRFVNYYHEDAWNIHTLRFYDYDQWETVIPLELSLRTPNSVLHERLFLNAQLGATFIRTAGPGWSMSYGPLHQQLH